MRTNRLSLLWLVSSIFWGTKANAEVEPIEWLLSQIRLGEVTENDELLNNSIYSLSLINPKHPELLSAQARYFVANGKFKEAEVLLKELNDQNPGSLIYQQGILNLRINEPTLRNQLQKARQLAYDGHLEKSRTSYLTLFGQKDAPNLELAVEFALLNDQIPTRRTEALTMMRELEHRYPGHARLRARLARRLLSLNLRDEGMNLIRKMAASHSTRDSAARIWLADIRRMQVSPASLASLQQFIITFASHNRIDEAQSLLIQQKELWASPLFRKRQTILARAANRQATLNELQQLHSYYKDDPEVIEALALLYSRKNQRKKANNLFEELLHNSNLSQRERWKRQWENNYYWMSYEQAKKKVANRQWDQAAAIYKKLIKINSNKLDVWLGLGDCAKARQQYKDAELAYQRALKIEPKNERTLLRLFSLYRDQNPKLALALLSKGKYTTLEKQGARLRADLLEQDAIDLEQSGYQELAIKKRQAALALTKNDPWRRYRTAIAMANTKKNAIGKELMLSALTENPQDSDLRYATALYLSNQKDVSHARKVLAEIPKRTRSNQMTQLDTRLAKLEIISKAKNLHNIGEVAAAENLLTPLLPDNSIALTLASWATERRDWLLAENYYKEILSNNKAHQEARLGLAELLLLQGDTIRSQDWLPTWFSNDPIGDNFNYYRRIANIYQQLGESKIANEIFNTYSPIAAADIPSPNSALFWRDAARQHFENGDIEEALNYDRKAAVAAGLISVEPLDDATLTTLTLSQDEDDWLVSSIRTDLTHHYLQKQISVSFDSDYWWDKDDLNAQTQMLQLETSLAKGRVFGRLERVTMGTPFFTDTYYNADFGTCNELDCWNKKPPKESGYTVAFGWKNEKWQMDFGTSPQGFEIADWLGGVSVRSKWHNIGWRATLSRRPLNNSLLSFGGAIDPATGISWGGIRATGLRVNLSYNQSGTIGHWGSIQQHLLTGKNVPDNWRTRLMGGSYYKLINKANTQVTIGWRMMAWHHEQNLSGYTLGRGGYFSPEQYLSLGIPIQFSQRYEDWSWNIGSTLSLSKSCSGTSQRYPLPELLPDNLINKEAAITGNSNNGIGYTLNAQFEYRLNSHWRIGGRFDIQQSNNYEPSHATIFLRYSFNPWLGSLKLQPQTLTQYAEFE